MTSVTPPPVLPDYAKLHYIGSFTLLTGASHPGELVERAKLHGYQALALADEYSVAGTTRAPIISEEHELKLIIDNRFTVRNTDGEPWLRLASLAQGIEGYGNLSEIITRTRLAAPEGEYRSLVDGSASSQGKLAHLRDTPDCLTILLLDYDPDPQQLLARTRWCQCMSGDRLSIALELSLRHADDHHRDTVLVVSGRIDISVVTAGGVQIHARWREPPYDVLTAIRLSKPLSECGLELAPSTEQAMRTHMQFAFFYQGEGGEKILRRTAELAVLCNFSLDEIEYGYPSGVAPKGMMPAEYLRAETFADAARRYPNGVLDKVHTQIEGELGLIAELDYGPFFLAVYDMVKFARNGEILCQG